MTTAPSSEKIEKVYEDNEILIINKSHNILVIPDRYSPEIPNLKTILKNQYPQIFVVHRLDFGTGGLILFAKTKISHKKLCTQFEKHTVEKRYYAVCENTLLYPFTMMLPISKRNYHGKYKINFKSGKKAITTFIPLKQNKKFSFIECIPKTGRSHQIRVHLKANKTPLVYDFLYNPKGDKKDKRLSLFAYFLKFIHPKTGKIMSFKIDISEFMKDTLTICNLLD